MPRERSAGLVLFRDGENPKFLLLYHWKDYWNFPKGNVEEGESLEETAIREAKEETGIKEIKIIPGFREKDEYFYRSKDGQTIYKEVIFFLGKTSEKEAQLSFEAKGFKWVSYEEALKLLKFKKLKNILEKGYHFIKKN